jgi:L-seryl-tRNA(Ser) seleniumtransferase
LNLTERLRSLPSVDEVLRCDQLAEIRREHPQRRLSQWVREAVEQCRRTILDGADIGSVKPLDTIVSLVQRQHAGDRGQSIQRVINATGVILHTNLGRAPLAQRAIARLSAAARYSNVELDLQSGRRSQRGERVSRLLAQLAGCDDAVVVNNCAAATVLVLQSIAAGREVLVSRGQLVEIGGGFRLPDVFRSAGVVLREVGTTNRTYLRDYEAAMGEATAAVLRVHRSNFQMTGFVTEPTIDELVTLRRPEQVAVIDDLGSGCIDDLSALGLSEPTVPQSVRAGADLTLFSGDKLLGGPQCGIIVGRRRWIEPLRCNPLMRAIRVDKLILAALEATIEIHLEGSAAVQIPALRMLSAAAAQIREHCESLQQQIAELCVADVVGCRSPVGGGSIPGAELDSFALRIASPAAEILAHRLRGGTPAVQVRVSDDCVLLDLRTVADDELPLLARCLRTALGREDQGAAS